MNGLPIVTTSPCTELIVPRPRDPFSLALEDLRDRATRGGFAPGRSVVIIEEARRLRLSTTPVREALAWLCGEGLMERAPRTGYLAPRLDASLVRDRFWVRFQCLATSLDLTAALAISAAPASNLVDEDAVSDLFDRLVRATGNRALIETFRRVDAQLRMLGDAENLVFADAAEEARELVRIETIGSRTQVLTAIDAFHRRRMENAAVIVLEVERRDRRSTDDD